MMGDFRFGVVLFVLMLLVGIADAVAVVPPLALETHPAPVSYPDQLHPVDVVAMSGEVSPAIDPCPWPQSPEERVRCWVEHAFEPGDWDSAVEVARWESAHTFDPNICFGGYTRGHWRCEPPNAERGKWGRATGLFQHRWKLWPERTARAYPGETLDIWSGWHSTLMAADLVYNSRGGWLHFHSCASSARWWRENRGVGGGGWVKTC